MSGAVQRMRLSEALREVSRGVGPAWSRYRVVGATREGLAPAKERPGKDPERYKLVEPGCIFYNPMRILIGSISMIDVGDQPGITSPDYVVFRCVDGLLHSRWFYHWLRSPLGEAFIRRLARGAVRERMLFRRLASAEIEVPSWEGQVWAAQKLRIIGDVRALVSGQLEAAKAVPAAYLREVFRNPQVQGWPKRRIGEVAKLLPARSVASDGDTEVQVVTTACLTEAGFDPSGVKTARMWARDALECRAAPGEILVARSNTPELVGRVSLYAGQPPRVVASDLTIRLSPHPQCRAAFLSSYLSFLYLTGYWREKAGGASGSMKKITRRQIAAEEVPLPDRSVQQRIAADLQASGDYARKIQQAAIGQLAEIERLPASVLRRAFNGEL